MSRKKPHAPSPRPSRSIATTVALVSAVTLGAAAIWLTQADAPGGASSETKTVAVAGAATVPSATAPAVTSPAASVATMPTSQSAKQAASSAKPAAPAAESAPAAGSAGQQAFIDPRTGKLRPAEHDEVAAATAAAKTSRLARTTAAAAPQEVFGADGSVGVVVPDELQPYAVATKAPDGTITFQDATGPTAAAKLVREAAKRNAALKPGSGAKKEERNDR